MNQCEKIIDHIKQYGYIDQRQALRFFGCGRLASRICDLKKAGYDIKTELVTVKNRDGSKSRVARYSFGGDI